MVEDWDTDAHLEADERRWVRREQLADEQRRRAELDERIDHLPFTLREASRAVDDVVARLLDRSGLAMSLSSVHVLVLARRGGPIVSVAQRLRMSEQAAGRLVKDLAGRGLVDIGVSPMDSRARLVRTTPEGERLLDEVRHQLFMAMGVVTDAVGEDHLVTLADQLAELALLDIGPPSSW